MADDEDVKKSHRPRQAGKKHDKKKQKNSDGGGGDARERNPRAFAIQSVNKAARQVRKRFLVEQIEITLFHFPPLNGCF